MQILTAYFNQRLHRQSVQVKGSQSSWTVSFCCILNEERNMMDLKETQISSELIYEGKFIRFSRDTIRLPNGKEGQRMVIRHPGAACVLAITKEDKVVLVRQWRYAADQAVLELPAGKLDVEDEDPAECALRELAEETPYTADRVRLLFSFYTAVGFCDEKMYLYHAEGVRLGSTLSNDEDEITETVLMSRDQVRKALQNDEIKDGKTLVGLQYWLMHGRQLYPVK